MTLLDDLTALQALFAESNHWTKGTMARAKSGEAVSPLCARASCWCLIGGIEKVTAGDSDRYAAVKAALIPHCPSASLVVANDQCGLDSVRKMISTATERANAARA